MSDNTCAMGTARISRCKRYRYELTRTWDEAAGTCAFVCLNPSTADARVDDPTLRRCIGFAKSWGYGRVVMLNAYAYRATDPAEMLAASNPIGPRMSRTAAEQTQAVLGEDRSSRPRKPEEAVANGHCDDAADEGDWQRD